MLVDAYAWISVIIGFSMCILCYFYSLKIYGLKTTLITSLLVTSFVLIVIISGWYGSVDLYGYPNFIARLGKSEFLFTDPITIFPSFFVTFELARYSLRKMHRSPLTYRDILLIAVLTSFYGFCTQFITDATAGAVGYYYFLTPPEPNVFGFPFYFYLAFTVYGLFGGIFLLFEKKFKNKIEVELDAR